MIHSIQEHGYLCFRNHDKPNTIDVHVPNDSSLEFEDFDSFLEELYNECVAFSYLDKSERGELYVQWRQDLDNEVNFALYESFTKGVATENATCETALPFCTDNGAYTFPAGVNSGSPCGTTTQAYCSEPYYCPGHSHEGSYTSCLHTSPNPAFYYLRIATAGSLNIKIYSEPRKDIDFNCWGPFENIENACNQLSCNNIVDCSYEGGTDDEHCHINNAQPGKYYILLLTNYSNAASMAPPIAASCLHWSTTMAHIVLVRPSRSTAMPNKELLIVGQVPEVGPHLAEPSPVPTAPWPCLVNTPVPSM